MTQPLKLSTSFGVAVMLPARMPAPPAMSVLSCPPWMVKPEIVTVSLPNGIGINVEYAVGAVGLVDDRVRGITAGSQDRDGFARHWWPDIQFAEGQVVSAGRNIDCGCAGLRIGRFNGRTHRDMPAAVIG